ncbi:MAG: hypothetical protein QXM08_04040 [Thermofilaceae archaeon]
MSEDKQLVTIKLPGWRTSREFLRYRIFSIDGEEVESVRRRKGRSKNYWVDLWEVPPGNYIVTWREVSRSGRHHCGYGLLQLFSDGKYEFKYWDRPLPEKVKETLCECLEPRN